VSASGTREAEPAMMLSTVKGTGLGIRCQATGEGVRVTEVTPGSPADKLGLEPGDVIVTVYGHPVTSAETWDWLTSYKNDYAALRIKDVRTGSLVTRHVPLG
jgi:C-terminal processing protease CtpA/Prc